jgi:uncharacterized protein
MAAHQFTISVSDLDAGGTQFRFPVRAAWLRGALEEHEATASGADGELAIRASRSGRDVVIHGTLRAELQAPCARCLEPVRISVDHPVTLLMVPSADVDRRGGKSGKGDRDGRDGRDEETELSTEEADTLPFEGDTVILDDFVRGELMLETPMIPLCREDCPGMRPPPSPSAGVETEHTDPRLLPLKRFAEKSKEKKE